MSKGACDPKTRAGLCYEPADHALTTARTLRSGVFASVSAISPQSRVSRRRSTSACGQGACGLRNEPAEQGFEHADPLLQQFARSAVSPLRARRAGFQDIHAGLETISSASPADTTFVSATNPQSKGLSLQGATSSAYSLCNEPAEQGIEPCWQRDVGVRRLVSATSPQSRELSPQKRNTVSATNPQSLGLSQRNQGRHMTTHRSLQRTRGARV